jgi:hypothetical protein
MDAHLLPYPSLAVQSCSTVIRSTQAVDYARLLQIIYSPPPVPPRSRLLNQPRVLPPDVVRPNAGPLTLERAMTPLIARPVSHLPPGDAPPPRRPIINLGSGSISLNHQLEAELFRRQ